MFGTRKETGASATIPNSVYRDLLLLNLARNGIEHSGVSRLAHKILYPGDSSEVFADQLQKATLISMPPRCERHPISFSVYDYDNLSIASRIARNRETTKEVLYSSVFSGYLATEEIRQEMIDGLHRLSVDLVQIATQLDHTKYEQG